MRIREGCQKRKGTKMALGCRFQACKLVSSSFSSWGLQCIKARTLESSEVAGQILVQPASATPQIPNISMLKPETLSAPVTPDLARVTMV